MMKILFIGHEASRSGAPILFLRLIKTLKEKFDAEPVILLKKGGALKEKFEGLGETLILRELSEDHEKYLLLKVVKKLNGLVFGKQNVYHHNKIKRSLRNVDLVFVNTITCGNLLRQLPLATGTKIVTYVHELKVATRSLTNREDVDFLLDKSSIVAVPSKAVHDFLASEYSFDHMKLRYLNYIIPQDEPLATKSELRKKYHLPPDNFIVCGCGKVEWRKGTDLFVLAAMRLLEGDSSNKITFIWIGADKDSFEYLLLKEEIDKSELTGHIVFQDVIADASEYIGVSDVFLLSSVEDPYPLVVLEAARHEVPTICFRGSGGATEFVGTDAGIQAKYLNIDDLAKTLTDLKDHKEKTKALGKMAKNRLAELHQDDVVINQLKEILNDIF